MLFSRTSREAKTKPTVGLAGWQLLRSMERVVRLENLKLQGALV